MLYDYEMGMITDQYFYVIHKDFSEAFTKEWTCILNPAIACFLVRWVLFDFKMRRLVRYNILEVWHARVADFAEFLLNIL